MADRAYGRNFGRVPDELLWDSSVSDRACRLYAALTRYAQQRDRVVPPRTELAARLCWSLDKLDKAIKELEAAGALHVQRHTHAKGETGQRTRESTYWLDGSRPDPSRSSAATPSRDSAANDGRHSAATKDQREVPGSKEPGTASDGQQANITLASWLDRSQLTLTPRNRARFGKGIRELLDAGTPEPDIAAGLDLWAERFQDGARITPGHLPDLVDQARNRKDAKAEARAEQDRQRAVGRRPKQPDPEPFVPDPGKLWGSIGLQPPKDLATKHGNGNGSKPEVGCCSSHTRTCEPPSELCCERCTEVRHPEHPEGVPCVLGVTAK